MCVIKGSSGFKYYVAAYVTRKLFFHHYILVVDMICQSDNDILTWTNYTITNTS